MKETERDAINNPLAGLVVYCTDCIEMQMYNGSDWVNLIGEPATPAWSCGDDFIDSRDEQIYTTVQIGGICWMAKNLAYLPQVDEKSDGSEDVVYGKYYYVYDYTPTGIDEAAEITNAKITSMYLTYGVLYNWNAAMNGATSSASNPSGIQGVCPNGWHLPSNDEWIILTDCLEGLSSAGGKMKESGTSHWGSPNSGATNLSGFTALPGGRRVLSSNGSFNNTVTRGRWWSSTENDLINAMSRNLRYNSIEAYVNNSNKSFGYSVRCIKD